MPNGTGGLRGDAANALKKVLVKLAGSGNMDVATLTAAMDDVVDEFRHLPPTGALTPADPSGLHKALGMISIPPVLPSLAAVTDKPTALKLANHKQQPVPPTADDDTITPPPGKIMCPWPRQTAGGAMQVPGPGRRRTMPVISTPAVSQDP